MENINLNRETLISICERAVVPYTSWSDRDSYSAQLQLSDIFSLLKSGSNYKLKIENEHTIWIDFIDLTEEHIENASKYYLNIDSRDDYFEEYGYENEMFDGYGLDYNDLNSNQWDYKDIDNDDFTRVYKGYIGGYLPTEKRLEDSDGEDWY